MTYAHPAKRLLFALAIALPATLALAQIQPDRAATRRAPAPPVNEDVIVAFKPDANTLRKHALAARADSTAVRTALTERASTLGARVGRTLQAGAAVGERVQVVRAAGIDATTLARQLSADPDVLYAVPNGRKQIVSAPNDPLYPAGAAGVRPNGPDSGQWYLRAPDNTIKSAIDIEAAWLRTTGNSNVVVAVLDTGVRFDHPDLGRVATGGRLLPGYDMVDDPEVANDGDRRDGDPSDPGDWTTAAENSNRTGKFYQCDPAGTGQARDSSSSWHGTATTSLIGAAANDGVGMAGTAPGVRVLPVRVLGKCFGNDADIQAGMLWAAGLHVDGVPDNTAYRAKVINLSLGADCKAGAPCVCSVGYQDVIDKVIAAGAVVVVAGGNSTGGPVGEPGNCRGVLTVAALRHLGTKVGYSDLGPQIGIAAPGGNCVNLSGACLYPVLAATNTGSQGPLASTWFDSFVFEYGTSFSAPLAAGVAALMFSQRTDLTPAQVIAAMKSSSRPFPVSGAGNGTNGLPVPACLAPRVGVDQDQCYCPNDGSLCGAGMLDAGRALAAVSGALARLDVTTAAPTAGASVALSGMGSSATPGASISQYAWSITSGGGIAAAFSTATNASTAALTPSAAGSFTVQLVVTDSTGSSNSSAQTITVAAAPAPLAASTGGGGGGAASSAWVAGVALAAALLRISRRRA